MSARTLLLEWLKIRLAPAASVWLGEKTNLFAAGAPDKTVFASFSACVRHAGKAPLALDPEDLRAAAAAVPGWNPSDWTRDEAARILLLAAMPAGPESAGLMDQLYQTADVGEAVALQKALAVLAQPQGHMNRAREAIRSNIKAVFDAVALRNPYPSLHFDEIGWNQMFVKALFVESPLSAIVGMDARANPALSRMLADLARERRAAGRPFTPELWRCVGPHADARAMDDLGQVLAQDAPAHQRAAALALASCPDARADLILRTAPALADAVRTGRLTWENLNHGE